MDSDKEYFALRAQQEREAAELATGQKSRHIHLELSQRYQELGDVPQAENSEPIE